MHSVGAVDFGFLVLPWDDTANLATERLLGLLSSASAHKPEAELFRTTPPMTQRLACAEPKLRASSGGVCGAVGVWGAVGVLGAGLDLGR